MKKIVRLRAHHGMCLAFFEGKGYSRGFTSNVDFQRAPGFHGSNFPK